MKTTKFLTILFALILGAAIDATAQSSTPTTVTPLGDNKWSFTMPAGNVKLNATMQNKYKVELATSVSSIVDIAHADDDANTSEIFLEDEVCKITIKEGKTLSTGYLICSYKDADDNAKIDLIPETAGVYQLTIPKAKVDYEDAADGYHGTITIDEPIFVATYSTDQKQAFATLGEALAYDYGDATSVNIALMKDYESTESRIVAKKTAEITIDFTGHSLTGSYNITFNSGTSTIKGDDKTNINAHFSVLTNAVLTINGGKYTSSVVSQAVISNQGTLTIEAGVFESTDYYALMNDATATIKGGTLKGDPASIYNESGVCPKLIYTNCYLKDNTSGNIYAETYNNGDLVVPGSDPLSSLKDVTVLGKHKFKVELPSFFTRINPYSDPEYLGEGDTYTFDIENTSGFQVVGNVTYKYLTAVDTDGENITYTYSDQITITKNALGKYEFQIPGGFVPDPRVPAADKELYDGIITISTPEPYAVLTQNNDGETYTFTFYCDELRGTRTASAVASYDVLLENHRTWTDEDIYTKITTLKFDESFGVTRPKILYQWFSKFSALTTIEGIEYFHTDNARDMIQLFNGCSSLESIDLSNFVTNSLVIDPNGDTRQGVKMSEIFSGCTALKTITMGENFTAEKASTYTKMYGTEYGGLYGMFSGCENLESIDLSHLKCRAIENIDAMFKNCKKLKSITFCDGFDMTGVTYGNEKIFPYSMFTGCESLETVDLSNVDLSQFTQMYYMFRDLKALKTVIFPTDAAKLPSNLTSMESMFDGCIKLENPGLENFSAASVTNMESLFDGCSSLEVLDLSNFTTADGLNTFRMFSGCDNLRTIYVDKNKWDASKLAESAATFVNNFKLVGGKGTVYDGTNNSNIYARVDDPNNSNPGYFTDVNDKGTYIIAYADVEPTDVTVVSSEKQTSNTNPTELNGTDATVIYPLADRADKIFVGWQYYSGETNATTTEKTVTIPANSVGHRSFTATWQDRKAYVVVSDDWTKMTFKFGDKAADEAADNTNATFTTVSSESYGPGWYNTANVKNNVTTVIFDETFQYYKPTSCFAWFNGFTQLSTITGTEYLNTSEVTSMNNMFYGCSSLKTIDFSKQSTSNVTNMNGMFNGCSSLEVADLKGLEVTNVTNMYRMFYNCSSLTTIMVANAGWNTDKVTNSGQMFYQCSKLIGNQGTGFSSSYIDNTYARIDDKENAPGYFTTGDYKIFYNLQEGELPENTTNPSSYPYPKNTAAIVINNPVRTGYTFRGWRKKGTTDDETSLTIPKDMVGNLSYTALWNTNRYTISLPANMTFNAATGLTVTTDDNGVETGTAAYDKTISFKVKDGYTVVGDVEYKYVTDATPVTYSLPTSLTPENGVYSFEVPEGDVVVTADVRAIQTITTADIADLISAAKTYDGGYWANAKDDKYYNPYNTDPALSGTTMLIYVNDNVTPRETVYFPVTAKYVNTNDANADPSNVGEANAIEVEVLDENASSLDAVSGIMSQLKNYTFAASKFYITNGVKINAKNLSINIQNTISKTYDGTVEIADFLTHNIPTITSGKIDGDDVSIASAKFDNAEIGFHKDGVTITLGGEDANNYYVAGKSSGTINEIPSATLTAGLGANIKVANLDGLSGLSLSSIKQGTEIVTGSGITLEQATNANIYNIKTAATTPTGDYTLTVQNENDKPVGKITLTVKDYTPTALNNTNWQSAISIPSTNAEAPGYNVAVSVNGVSLTANNDGNFVVNTEGANVSVTYTITDNAGNTYHSVSKTVKIDKTAPTKPTAQYTPAGSTTPASLCGTNGLILPVGTEIDITAADVIPEGLNADKISGIASILRSDDDGATFSALTLTDGHYIQTLNTAGTYQWQLKAKDAADNESEVCYVDVTVKPYYSVTLPPYMEFVGVNNVDVNNPLTHSFPAGEKVYFKLTDANAYTIRPHLYDIDDGYEAGSDGKVYVYPVGSYESYYITVPERNVTLSAGVKKIVTITASLEDFVYTNPDNVKPVVKKDDVELTDVANNISYSIRLHDYPDYTTFTGLESLSSLMSVGVGTRDLRVEYESDTEYGVYAPVDASGNYQLYFTVSKKPVYVTITGIEKEYDGTYNVVTQTADQIYVTVKDSDAPDANVISFSPPFTVILDENSKYSGVTVGDYTGIPLQISSYLQGADLNYDFQGCTYKGQVTGTCFYSTTATGVIKPKEITVSGITAEEKLSDGTTDATLDFDDVEFDGLVANETNEPNVSATGTFENADLGQNKTVNITDLSISGNDNYVLASTGNQTTTSADIYDEINIAFNGNGQTIPSTIQPITKEYYGDDITLTDLPTIDEDDEPDGYDFLGWSIDPDATAADDDIIINSTGDITLYAVWEVNTYTVNFYAYKLEDGVYTPYIFTYATVTHGSEIAIPTGYATESNIPGYEYNGNWYYDGTNDEPEWNFDTDVVTSDLDLYPKFDNVAEYTITYDLKGGSLAEGESNPDTYTIESETFTLNNPTKNGYDFAGWTGTDLDEATTVVDILVGSTGNREYTANWTPTEYTITYKGLDDATNAATNPDTYTIGTETITLANPTKEGSVFAGWKKGNNFVTQIAKGSTGNITLTATWDEYTIAADPINIYIYKSGNLVMNENYEKDYPVTKADLSYTVMKNGEEITTITPIVSYKDASGNSTDQITFADGMVSATTSGAVILSLPETYNCAPVDVTVTYTELPELLAYFNYGTENQEQFDADTYYDFDDDHKEFSIVVPKDYPTNGASRIGYSYSTQDAMIYSVTFTDRPEDPLCIRYNSMDLTEFEVRYKDVLTVTAKDFVFGTRPVFNSNYLEIKDSDGDEVTGNDLPDGETLTFSYKKQGETDDKYISLSSMSDLCEIPVGNYTFRAAIIGNNDQVVSEGVDDFEITPQTARVMFEGGTTSKTFTYTGSEITPDVIAQYGVAQEDNGTQYTTIDNTNNKAFSVNYSDNVNVGTATITFTDEDEDDNYIYKNNNNEDKKLTFTIAKATLSLPEKFDISQYVEITKTVDGNSTATLKTGADAIEINGVNNEKPIVKITSAKFVDQTGAEQQGIGTGYYIHAEFVLTDADVNANYQLATESKSKNFAANAEIKAEEVNITAEQIAELVETTKTYDGGTWVMDNAGNALKPDNSTISLGYNEYVILQFSSIEYEDADVASNKTITATASTTDFTGTDGKIYKLPSTSFTISTEGSITPADQNAPNLESSDETICGKQDGSISGVTAAMEYYIVDPDATETTTPTYISADGKDWSALAPGTYKIRYAATDNYNASPDATVTIAEGSEIVVKFFDGNDEVTALEQSLCNGEQVTYPTGDNVPTKEGYTLDYWTYNGMEWNFATQVYDDLSLTAHWTANTYTVTFPDMDENVSGIQSPLVFTDATKEKGEPNDSQYSYIFKYGTTDIQFLAKEGYEVSDVKMSYNNTNTTLTATNGIYTISSMPAADVTISATVKEKVKLYVQAMDYTCGSGTWSAPSTFYAIPYTANGSGTLLSGTWTLMAVDGSTEVTAVTSTGSYKAQFTPTDNQNYTWAISDEFTITVNNKPLPDGIALEEPNATFTYDGTAKTPTIAGLGDLTKGETNDYVISYANNINAGTAASYTVTGKGCYAGSEKSDYFTIAKASLTVTANNHTITYGEDLDNNGVTYVGFVNNETATVLGGKLAYDYSYTKYGNVGGNYTITPKGLTSANYEIEYQSGTLTVEPKEIGIAWSETTEFPYDGDSHILAATATELVNGDQCSLTVEGSGIVVGEYTAKVAALSNSNYKLPTDQSKLNKTFKITAASIEYTAADYTGTYDGQPHAISVSVSKPATGAKVLYRTSETGDFTATPITVTDVKDNKTVYFKISADNYTTTAVDSRKIELQPQSVENPTITFVNAESPTYDGSKQEPLVTVAIGDKTLTEGTDYTVEYTDNTNAGKATVTINSVENGNYTFTGTVSTTFDIEPADIDQSAVTALPKKSDTQLEYNGEAQPLVQAGTTTIGKFVYSLDGTNWQDDVPTGKDAEVYLVYYKVVDDNYNDYVPSDNNPIEVAIKRNVTLDVAISAWSYGATPVTPVIKKDGEEISIDAVTLKYTDAKNNEVAISNTTPAGNYTLTVTYPATDTELEVTKTVSFSIAPATFDPNDLTADQKPTANKSGDNDLVYNSAPQALVIAPKELPEGYTIQYKLSTETEYGTTIPTATNAGKYTVNVRYVGDVNHTSFDGADIKDIKIDQAPLTITPKSGQSKKYGDREPVLTYTSVPATLYGIDDKITGNLSRDEGDNVGDYAINIGSLTAGDNYEITLVSGVKFAIEKADALSISNLLDTQKPTAKQSSDANGLVYDGTAQELVAAPTSTLPDGYAIKYKLGDATSAEIPTSEEGFAANIPEGKNVGTYTVYYYYSGDANHDGFYGGAIEVKIIPAALTVAADNITVSYGDPKPDYTATIAGLLADDTEATALGGTLAVNDEGYTNTTAVGEYTLTPSGYTADNYDITFVAGKLTVEANALDVNKLEVVFDNATAEYTYNGEKQTPTFTLKYNGVEIPASEYDFEFSNSKNVGEEATVTIKNKNGGNYTIPDKTVNFSIVPKEVSITWSNTNFTYDGSEHKPTATANNLIEGDVCEITVEGAQTNVGEDYIATATGLTGAASDNYKLPADNLTASFKIAEKGDISKDDLADTQKPTANRLTYNGTAQVLVNAPEGTLPEGYTIQYKLGSQDDDAWSNNIPEGTDAGTYVVNVRYVGDNNHTDFDGYDKTVAISKADVTVTAKDASKTFGEAEPEMFVVDVAGNIGDDAIRYNVARATGENVGTYAITPTGDVEQGNYKVAFVPGTFTINPKLVATPTIVLEYDKIPFDNTAKTPSIKVYDGETLITSNEYTVEYKDNINPGTATVIVTDNADGNYTVSRSTTLFTIQAVYTVTFHTAHGTAPAQKTGIVEGSKITAPTDGNMTATGYTFLNGWYTDGVDFADDTKWDFANGVVDRNLDLYAKWNVDTYTITLTLNGGTLDPAIDGNKIDYTVESANFLLPTPQKEGCEFKGWRLVAETQSAAMLNVTIYPANAPSNKAYEAVWEEIGYTISLNLDGGKLDPAIESNTITGVHFGESIVVPEKMMPTRNGYNFGGWTYNGSNLTADMKMPAANIELVAVWNIKTITVHFVDVDGSKLYDDYTAEYNTPFPVIDKPEDKDGRTFVSWNPQLPDNMPAEETTYKAVRRELHERSITFDMGAAKGDVAAPASIIAEADVDISNELPTESLDWEGHEFIGWMSSDDNQMVDNLPAVMPDHDVVFTAQWKANTYYVTYMVNDVEYGEKQPVEYGKKIALREIVKEGYTFSGWSYNGSSISNMTMPASDITLVGTLTINSYPITFYVDNQYYSSTENNVYYGTPIQQLLPEVKAPTGYSFSGWNYGNDAVPADMTMPDHAIDIKGTFVKNKYTITYVYDNGDDNKKVEVLFGDEIKPDDPTRNGYNFIGWDKEVPFNMPAEDVTITAQWQIKTFTISFQNYDGTVLQTIENVEYGSVPAYTGETPEKAVSAGIGHVFEGWVDDAGNKYGKDDVLPEAKNNATYTARFTDYDNEAPTITSVTVNGIEFVDTDVDVVECIESGKMTINATDDNSGVAKIEYTIHSANDEAVTKVYTEPVTLEPGYYVISIVATDNAGNRTAPMDVVAIVRREASLSTTEYTYTQLSGKDVVLEGLDLDGASVHSITIDGVEYTNIFKPETNALDHSLLDNVKIGSHTLHLYTDFGGEKHDTGIEFYLTVNGFVITTEQKDDIINAEGFCQGDISVVTLAFLDRDCPKYYKIKGIHDKYVPFEDWGSLGKDLGKLMFDVTDDFQPGTIEFEVSFTDDPSTNTESEFESFKVKINASNDRILKLFNDLIAIDNHDDLFTAFQWYKDGMKIEGADQQYYQSDGNIVGNYSAYVTTTSGETVKVCYVNFEDDGLSKSLKRSVNAYPNPARAYEEITLELLNYDEAEYEGCVIKIVNAQGAIVATIDNCDRINTVSLPSGTYTGYVIRSGKNGDRVSFKLIVK